MTDSKFLASIPSALFRLFTRFKSFLRIFIIIWEFQNLGARRKQAEQESYRERRLGQPRIRENERWLAVRLNSRGASLAGLVKR